MGSWILTFISPEVAYLGNFSGNWMQLCGGIFSFSFGFPGPPRCWSHTCGTVLTCPCHSSLSLLQLTHVCYGDLSFILGDQAFGGRRDPIWRQRYLACPLPLMLEEMLAAENLARWLAGCLIGNSQSGPFEAVLRPIW